MGDFLCEAISECESIDMLQRGLEHIKNKIRQLESENETDEDEKDCNNCKHSDVYYRDEPLSELPESVLF